MIVYRDLISGDEMLSDAFKLLPVHDSDGTLIEGLMMCESKLIKKGGEDIDIGAGNAFGGGGGEDEDGGGGVDNTVQMVNNVIDGFQYNEMPFSSANEFKTWLKDYCIAIRDALRAKGKPKEFIQGFMALAPNIAKFLVKNFKEVQFFVGPSYCAESMVFSIYPEGATTPNFYFIMAGFDAEKF